ncbi:trigger factor [uncultured Dermacoccus sp.]|uniref:trigger factor n=1 Tax=uncultured Dermacoccus sp. TaxID=339343 RepID=UPI002591B2C0|nr:trigger factor [uncultured Dermacoccus sp.]
MKSAVENLTPTRVKLTVDVTADELKPSIEKAYTTIGSQVQIPGFRKGKVPAKLIEQRFGRAAVIQEAVNEALPELYTNAIVENDVKVLGQPEVDITEFPLEDGAGLSFTAEVDIRPEITLPAFDTLEVEVEPIEVSDADIDERIAELRERFGTLESVERKAKKGDFVTIDLSATIDGNEIDAVSGVSYEIGSGTMLDGLDEALTGLKAGEETTFTSPLAGGEHEGENAECTVKVESVKVRELPELDDEFAQLASSFDTIDELKADLRGEVERTKRFEQGVQARDKVLEVLLEQLDIPVPESIVTEEVTNHLEGENRLDDDEHRAEVTGSTRQQVATQLLLDEIVEKHEIQVGQDELIEYLIMSAQQYGMDPNTFAQALDAQGQVPAIMGEVARRKALATVLESATVKDTAGNVVDLNAAVDTGDDEDEAQAADGENATPVASEDADADAADKPAKKAAAKKTTTKKAATKKTATKKVAAPAEAADAAPAEAADADSAEAAEKPAKKAAAKKTAAKKTATKTAAKKTAAKKTAKKAVDGE